MSKYLWQDIDIILRQTLFNVRYFLRALFKINWILLKFFFLDRQNIAFIFNSFHTYELTFIITQLRDENRSLDNKRELLLNTKETFQEELTIR